MAAVTLVPAPITLPLLSQHPSFRFVSFAGLLLSVGQRLHSMAPRASSHDDSSNDAPLATATSPLSRKRRELSRSTAVRGCPTARRRHQSLRTGTSSSTRRSQARATRTLRRLVARLAGNNLRIVRGFRCSSVARTSRSGLCGWNARERLRWSRPNVDHVR